MAVAVSGPGSAANPPESPYQQFGKDFLFIGLANILIALTGIIVIPFLTKTLGAFDYGIWAQAQVTVALVSTFLCLGFPNAVVRFLAPKTSVQELRKEFYGVFSVVALAALVGSILIIVLAEFIASAFFEGDAHVVRMTGLMVLCGTLSLTCMGLLRALRRTKLIAILMVVSTYAEVGLIAYLVLNGNGLHTVILVALLQKVVVLGVSFVLVARDIGIGKPDFSGVRPYLKFGLPVIPATISSWVVASSDRYVIVLFLGAASAGVYAAAYGIGNILLTVGGILVFVLPPALAKAYDAGQTEIVRTHLKYALKYMMALAIPFVFGAAVLSRELLAALSTPQIAEDGKWVVPLVAVGCFFWSMAIVPGNVLFMAEKTRITASAWAAAAVFNLGSNILIVPHIGIIGAAVTTAFAYLLAAAIMWHYARKQMPMDIDWPFVIKSLIASAVMSLSVWLISPQGMPSIIASIVAGIAIYAVVLVLLRGFAKEEFAFLRELLGLIRRGRSTHSSQPGSPSSRGPS